MGSAKKKELTPDARRLRREIWIMVAVAITIILLYFLEAQIFQSQKIFPWGVNLVFFGLINLNIVLIITLLFLFLRNIAKLIFERRRDVFGAKLRTKLVAAFMAFALVPTILFFYVSSTFIIDSVDRWFNVQIENSLSRSLDVAQTFYNSFEHNSRFYAEKLSNDLTASKLLEAKKSDLIQTFLDKKRADYNLGQVSFQYIKDSQSLVSKGSTIPDHVDEDIPETLLESGREGEINNQIHSSGGSEVVYGIAPVYATTEKQDIIGTLSVGYFIPMSLVVKTQEIRRTFEEYRQLELLKSPIKSSYLIVLILISLLIFFSATWFGFYLARGLTQPIQRLADATQEVSDGNLDYYLQVEASDEIGQLVGSFNKMTADLRESKEQTILAHRDLQGKNVELDQRRLYMETVLKNITAGVVSLDGNGVIETANRAAMRMLNFTVTDPVGKAFSTVLGRRRRELINSILEESATSSRETIFRQEELAVHDRLLTLFISCSKLTDEEGRSIGHVMVLEDLTQLLKAQRMAAWQEVARRIAHEIKNPLTPIKLSAQRLQKHFGEKVSGEEEVFFDCTNMIIQQVEEMKSLVNEFSKFARLAEIKPTPNDLNEIVGEAILLYQEANKNVVFQVRRDKDVPIFRFDRDQIKRVLINVLDNAVAANDGKGRIVVLTKLMPTLNAALLEVADDGCGIPPEYRSRLFEPYFSTKKKGTGLGLAIVNRIVQDHNGYIRLRDNEPVGTIVSIELPLGARNRDQVA